MRSITVALSNRNYFSIHLVYATVIVSVDIDVVSMSTVAASRLVEFRCRELTATGASPWR
jgi:hypothetical protein